MDKEKDLKKELLLKLPEAVRNKIIAAGYTPEDAISYEIARRKELVSVMGVFENSGFKKAQLFVFIVNGSGRVVDVEINK